MLVKLDTFSTPQSNTGTNQKACQQQEDRG